MFNIKRIEISPSGILKRDFSLTMNKGLQDCLIRRKSLFHHALARIPTGNPAVINSVSNPALFVPQFPQFRDNVRFLGQHIPIQPIDSIDNV